MYGGEFSAQSVLALLAENDLVLGTAKTKSMLEESHYSTSGSGFSSKSHTSWDKSWHKVHHGVELEGGRVLAYADNHLSGQSVIAVSKEGDSVFYGGSGINITSAVNEHFRENRETSTRSGMLTGKGKLGVTFGQRTEVRYGQEEVHSESDAQGVIGSEKGDIQFISKGKVEVHNTDLITDPKKKVRAEGTGVSITSGKDVLVSSEGSVVSESGLTLAFSSPVTDAIQSGYEAMEQAKRSKNPKLSGLLKLKAAQEAMKAAQNAGKVAKTLGSLGETLESNGEAAANPAVKIAVGIGGQSQHFHSDTKQERHHKNSISSGTVELVATEGKVYFEGDMDADKLHVSAPKGIEIKGVKDRYDNQTKEKSAGGNVGVFVGFNGNSYGVGIEASGNVGRGKSNSYSDTYQNSVINVNKLETFSEDGALVLDAAVINAGSWAGRLKDVVFNSRQDTMRYKSEQMQAGASGSITYGSGGGVSGYVGYSNAKMNLAQVNEQTGIHVGKGGMDVIVRNHTQNNGGILTSDAEKGRNRFSTGTYGESHIENHSELKTRSISASGGTGGFNPMNTMMSLLGNRNESERSTTYATIGGNIEIDIRDEAGQKARTGKTIEETLSGLHRDIDNANGKVNQPDMREVEELRAMATVIVDIVNNAEQIYTHSERERIEKAKLALGKEAERLRQAGVLRENFANDADYKAAAKALDNVQSDYDKKYGTGSAFRRGVNAATAVLQGLLTGNNRQALVGGLSPYANEFIKGQTEENSLENKIAHGILSALEFQLTGQSAYLGALTGIVAESSAEILAGVVYGKAPSELTEGEKQQVVALSQVASALATVVAGGNGETAASAMASAKSAVENNSFGQSYTQWKKEEELRKNDPEAYAKLKEEQFKIFTDALGIAADFTPVLGDMKSFAEAEDSIDYTLAVIGVIPGSEIVTKPLKAAKESIQKAKAAEKLGNVAEAVKHQQDAARYIDNSVNGFYEAKEFRRSFEDVYGKGNVKSTTVPPDSAKNVKLAGKKHPVTGVPFDNKGFPIFDKYSAFDTRVNIEKFRGLSYKEQMKEATKDLALAIRKGQIKESQFTPEQLKAIYKGEAKIPDYTWHHHQDVGRMQLVRERMHRETGHIGGEAIKKGK